MKYRRFLGLILLLCMISCNRSLSERAVSKEAAGVKYASQSSPVTSAVWRGKIIDLTSTLDESKESSWKFGVQQIGSSELLSEIQFLDETYGWIASSNSLYRTNDGGSTWQRVNVALPQQAWIRSVFFVNRLIGWVAAGQCTPGEFCDSDRMWLMQTTDGGQSWQLQSERKDSVASAVRFVDEQNGWLIGTKYKNWGLSPFSPLVLRTSDQGRHWTDLSAGINRILKEEPDRMKSATHDQAVKMIPEGKLTLTVLTGRMRIFKTIDGGETWNQIVYLRDEPDQTAIRHLGANGGRYFLAGGAASEEGMWGILAQEQNTNSWIRYRL